jgi:hypothetical protein
MNASDRYSLLLVAAAVLALVIAVPCLGQVDAPNAPLWASVLLRNGVQGSGTIITPEGLGVTCGHLFRGTIGGKFDCYVPAGGSEFTRCEATLLYHRLGNDEDIALFSIPREFVRGYCPVPDTDPPPGQVRAVGYPQAIGPTLVLSDYVDQYPGRDRWRFNQHINNGQSGGGIFQGNYLVGVMVEKNVGLPGQPGNVCHAIPLKTIVETLQTQCGPNGCLPGLGAFRPQARPNRPLGQPPLGNGHIPPAAPRDDAPGPVEEPLVPVPQPKPADDSRLAKIEKLLAELAARKPEPGPQGEPGPEGKQGPRGEPGPQGEPGKDCDPTFAARLEALEKRLADAPGPLPTRETLYFTARGLKSCERSDALADKLYDRGFPLRIITLTPEQTNVSGLPMVFTADKRRILGESNVLTFLSMQLQ